MVRSFIKSLLSVGALLFTANSMASTSVPLFHKCVMSYDITSVAFFAQAGGGNAKVTCTDNVGVQTFNYRAAMLGLGVTFGVCRIKGEVSAAGVGFSVADFIRVMGQADVGVLVGDRLNKQVGVGAMVSPLLNGSVVVGSTESSGPCVGLGSLKGFTFY